MKPGPSLEKQLDSLSPRAAAFIEPMECHGVSKLLDGPQWVYELKRDGCRAIKLRKGASWREWPNARSGLNDAFAFFDGVDFVDGGDLKGFLCAARPQDFDAIDFCGPAKAEVQALVGAGSV